ncbi:Nramp-domain-containing protein [Gymnopus androsaceus JB14]|uniref:Nramp-domain-containing protein n=1 Tax=Gymnopus androsaceus JB14 TaxID=1447944 RepID=A0A6A4IJR6_9AGAR|nr:Nramp-domain-containing protein [Gymnopus androsaceus JB14]
MSTPSLQPGPSSALNTALLAIFNHLRRHVGVGIVCAVGYFDPGNWSVDLQAGASFGYRPMLFVTLLSGLGAMILQSLACRLGCVTGIDLASHCRLLLHDHPSHPRLVRYLVLGSAIGICLIFPTLPLWAGVVLTSADVLVFLLFSDPSRGQRRSVRIFEIMIMAMVFSVFASFVVLLIRVHPHWKGVILGYIPDKKLFKSHPSAIYAAVGILGATIMPHTLFLGSFLATHSRVAPLETSTVDLPGPSNHTNLKRTLKTYFIDLFRITPAERAAAAKDYRTRYGERENSTLSFVKDHLNHLIIDSCSSIVILSIPINSAIVILSATVFFKELVTHDTTGETIGLFDAHTLIRTRLGSGSAFLFAFSLVMAGQSSSITATLAGQIVGEGFIEWRVSPFLRRLLTRAISLVPAVVVAVSVGRNGIDNLLIISQVVLSVMLPFIVFPLIYLTSSKVVMRVRKPQETPTNQQFDEKASIHEVEHVSAPAENSMHDSIQEVVIGEPIITSDSVLQNISALTTQDLGIDEIPDTISIDTSEYIDYSNGRIMSTLAYLIWALILVANVYTMVVLGQNN